MLARLPLIEQIRIARKEQRIPLEFRSDDVREECNGFAKKTYSNFLSKHRKGNPSGYTEYFKRISRGLYKLL